MNANYIINMIVRMVTRQLINRGIRGGMGLFARKPTPGAEMTEADREQARQGAETAKNARKALRASRRISRM